MLAIDAHTHILPPTQSIWGVLSWPPEQLLQRMNENGIDKAVVVNAGLFLPEEIKTVNNFVAEAVKKYPDRLVGFASCVPPLGDFAIQELKRCVQELGMKGIKLYPPKPEYLIDSAVVYPVVEAATKFKIPITIHSDFSNATCTPYQVARLADRFPEATLIMAHMGLHSDLYMFTPDIVKRYENVVLDTAATPDHPNYTFVDPIRTLGLGRVVFGSDALPLDQAVALKKLEMAEKLWGLTKEEKKHIIGENMARILGIRHPG